MRMLLAAGALVALPADAADLPQDAVRYRQGIMTALAWNLAPLAYMVKGDHAFDDARFTVLAARIAVLSTMALEGFSSDTAAEPSHSSAAVWQQQDDFKQRMHTLETTSAALAKAAQRGDQAQMRVLFADTVIVCKACHDQYLLPR